ncbi:DUF6578 domain-containing protein [Microbacterium oxydans]|uniref:DUF6578 domain-containing protein n=1 Tax=Microbacterium oxydans TaxID=82380 RepID=UPI00128F1EBF|nr:DUF6578 domain-containing protein [Microbacterium oxydans]
MTRVWLSRWEWRCCGTPFAVGDEVDFGIMTRDTRSLVDRIGHEVAATVDALEAHHDEEYVDRMRGRVRAVSSVTHEVVERRVRYSLDRRAGVRSAARPGDKHQSSKDVHPDEKLTRESFTIEAVPNTTELRPVQGVPSPEDESIVAGPVATPALEPIPDERRRRVHSGWIVDVEETGVGERKATHIT